jgi:hypothetical protein
LILTANHETLVLMKKILSKAEMARRIEKASEAEDVFPGVLGMLGNPVAFAARWGLPLSKSYLKHVRKGNAKPNGKVGSTHRQGPHGNGTPHTVRRKAPAT